MTIKEVACPDLNAALDEWRGRGFRLDHVYPAEEPHTAAISRGEERIRLTSRPAEPPFDGTLPEFRAESVLTRGGTSGVGRAGMHYRDLIPGRLGGRYIASHITIPVGGPVEDWVHYHGVAFQMIYVAQGWVRVVYEDQGEPFVMRVGDLVLQPPYIRHRVLDSSAGLEVVEIGCPAMHKTFSEHELTLPNGVNGGRRFSGQSFLHHVAAHTPWTPFHGGEAQETAMRAATGGLAGVRTIRPVGADRIRLPSHEGELNFGFVLAGEATLEHGEGARLNKSDAFVIPPGESWTIADASKDFLLLHVTTEAMPAAIPAEA